MNMKRRLSALKKNCGITLVECVIAMCVVGISSAFFATAVLTSTNMLNKGAGLYEVSTDAQKEIEGKIIANTADYTSYVTIRFNSGAVNTIEMNCMSVEVDRNTASGVYYRYYRK